MLDICHDFENDDCNDDYMGEEEYEEKENYINEYKGSIFINENAINIERENIIKEAMENLGLKRNDAILVMIYYRWNLDKLETWYDNVEQNRVKVGIELSKEAKELFKKEKIESNGNCCLICYEDEKENQNNLYSLNCGHKFCEECWAEYLKEKIKYPLNALQVKCPQKNCSCIVYEELYSKFLKDKINLEKLNKAIYKNFIDRNQDIKQCPNEYCHFYLKTNAHFAREINCLCGISYCFKCSKESHIPIPCEMFNKWNKLRENSFYITSEEEKSDKWIHANTKECPICHQRIEKSRGCNYMLCDKKVGGCGYAFCYVCETEWSKHSKDHFFCNKYQSEEVKQKEKIKEKIKEDLEIELIEEEFLNLEMNFNMNERLYLYYSKYKNYLESIEKCNNNLKKELEEKISILTAVHSLNSEDLNLFRDAVETVIKTKKILKNSYIFGYYMKNTEQKKLFEKSQEDLELKTGKLHKLLIDEQLNIIIQSFSDNFHHLFFQYKFSLKSLINTINKNRESFIEEIEYKYFSDLDEKLIDY